MSSNVVKISPEAALRETMELADYFRNRNLILAEQLAVVSKDLEQARAELEALRPPVDDEALAPSTAEVH